MDGNFGFISHLGAAGAAEVVREQLPRGDDLSLGDGTVDPLHRRRGRVGTDLRHVKCNG